MNSVRRCCQTYIPQSKLPHATKPSAEALCNFAGILGRFLQGQIIQISPTPSWFKFRISSRWEPQSDAKWIQNDTFEEPVETKKHNCLSPNRTPNVSISHRSWTLCTASFASVIFFPANMRCPPWAAAATSPVANNPARQEYIMLRNGKGCKMRGYSVGPEFKLCKPGNTSFPVLPFILFLE